MSEELGDLLFSVVNVCRKAKQDAEVILDNANRKFKRRMTAMGAHGDGVASLDDWEIRWQKVKDTE